MAVVKPLLKTRFRVRPTTDRRDDHWLGGRPFHKNAACPVCEKPLLLLWDLNCQEIRSAVSFKLFKHLNRLPLYYCWGCVGDLFYQVVSDQEIKIIASHHGRKGAGAEYDGFPEFFTRAPIVLEEMPVIVKRILANWDMNTDIRGSSLSPADSATLAEFFGHPVDLTITLFFHQFGGEPLARSWEDVLHCPNPDCSRSWLDKILGRKKGRPMKFLAGILNDPPGGLPMIEPLDAETAKSWNFFVSVQFHVCDHCSTICACNRGD